MEVDFLRTSGDQAGSSRRPADQGRQRLRLAEDRSRRPPPGRISPFDAPQSATPARSVWVYPVVDAPSSSTSTRPTCARHLPARAPAPAHQKDRLSRAPDPHPTGIAVAARPAARTPEPRRGWKCCAPGSTKRNCRSASGRSRRWKTQDRHRLGSSDQKLRPAALSDGQGPAHRVETSDSQGVLDGDLDPFMGAALAQRVGDTG